MKTVLIILGVIALISLIMIFLMKNKKVKVIFGTLVLLIVMFVSGY